MGSDDDRWQFDPSPRQAATRMSQSTTGNWGFLRQSSGNWGSINNRQEIDNQCLTNYEKEAVYWGPANNQQESGLWTKPIRDSGKILHTRDTDSLVVCPQQQRYKEKFKNVF